MSECRVSKAVGQEKPVVVYIALPGYGSAHPGAVRGVFRNATNRGAYVGEQYVSLLAMNFNSHLCNSLNLRKQFPIKYFAMLHSDIEPEEWWVDLLIAELERTGADIMSCVVPFKSPEGLTSTGIGHPDQPWSAYLRLTMQQVERLPDTFSSVDLGYPDWPLLVNTGCWVARLDRPWVESIGTPGGFPGFTINDRIVQRDGSFVVDVESEDWFASRWWWRAGLKVMATKKVKLNHHGNLAFPNQGAWGFMEKDSKAQGPMDALEIALEGHAARRGQTPTATPVA